MSDTQENVGTTTTSFGVTSDVKSSNVTPFKGGLHKGVLVSVVKEEVGKEAKKFLVLTFTFKDLEGIKTFKHSEFAVIDGNDIDKRVNGLNVRIKHLYETFAPFPSTGLGVGATDWNDFFTKIAVAFNTNNSGKPIYKKVDGTNESPILVWLKLTYYKNNLNFPLSPNFIERVEATTQGEPKTLVIDKRYDVIEQTAAPAAGQPGIIGGAQGGNGSATGFVF